MNECAMFRMFMLKRKRMLLKDISVVGERQQYFVEYGNVKKQVRAHCKDCAISEAV